MVPTEHHTKPLNAHIYYPSFNPHPLSIRVFRIIKCILENCMFNDMYTLATSSIHQYFKGQIRNPAHWGVFRKVILICRYDTCIKFIIFHSFSFSSSSSTEIETSVTLLHESLSALNSFRGGFCLHWMNLGRIASCYTRLGEMETIRVLGGKVVTISRLKHW